MSDAEVFDFPVDMTRRERWLFEKYSGGLSFMQFSKMLATDPTQITTQAEAALVFVAVHRTRPAVSIDQVLDSEWELHPPPDPDDEDAAPLEPTVAEESPTT